ncbi:amidase family protein [Paraburkholderia fungorum]
MLATFPGGGASSGSAVAVATGQVSLSISSDTGGSGHVPAALNNIVGLKSTPGVIDTEGFLYCNRTFDVAPVFALTVADAAQVFEVLTGQQRPHTDTAGDNASVGFRFGVPHEGQLQFFGNQHVRACYLDAVEMLAGLGGEAVRIDYTPFSEAIANPLGHAAISVPAGFTDRGLPFGLSLVGPASSEHALLALSARSEGRVARPLGATDLRVRT